MRWWSLWFGVLMLAVITPAYIREILTATPDVIRMLWYSAGIGAGVAYVLTARNPKC
ncbi:hypothetical protein [Pseudarthrobacter sp. PS3-L1]|uniref:hypothetical protein n=1 Tax=Pseudarthrobacter sp. PS3-L1 TaxID=3046207 RepID=UPI0024BB648F|nr:hypothetical protein [Pseudarthrobacter sp. PS3-L1]MDJ0321687.1 hypothetical protein [Pseudarthrobacter sp. PS3-L1]